jgi:hypothetical protein
MAQVLEGGTGGTAALGPGWADSCSILISGFVRLEPPATAVPDTQRWGQSPGLLGSGSLRQLPGVLVPQPSLLWRAGQGWSGLGPLGLAPG